MKDRNSEGRAKMRCNRGEGNLGLAQLQASPKACQTSLHSICRADPVQMLGGGGRLTAQGTVQYKPSASP